MLSLMFCVFLMTWNLTYGRELYFFCQLWDITLWCDSQTLILKNLLYTWKRIFILKKFFFFICQFVFHRVHDLFKEFIISYFVRAICCDSTNAKWIFNHIGMIFQVINVLSNPVNDILSQCQSAIRIDNQQYKQKMTDVMKEKLNPLVEEYRRINSKPK